MKKVLLGLLFVGAGGCLRQSAEQRYFFADQLTWEERYPGALLEFDQLVKQEGEGHRLAQRALYRKAQMQALWLHQPQQAIETYQRFLEAVREYPLALLPEEKALLSWEAQLQQGELLFQELRRYAAAMAHYQNLWKDWPHAQEAPLFLFRMGKSAFELTRFDFAFEAFEELGKWFPKTPWEVRSWYERGWTRLSQAGGGESCRAAEPWFQKILQEAPTSPWVSEAKMALGLCLEEKNELEKALDWYEKLQPTYSSPRVIALKRIRIRERLAQQARTSDSK